MRRLVLLFALLVPSAVPGPSLAQLPASLDELKERIASESKDPKAAARLWFDAVFVYTTVDKELGTLMITEMTRDKGWQKSQRYLVKTLEESPFVFRSYAVGATPENDYAMDPGHYELKITRELAKPFADREANAYYKLFIASSGAASPRPMTFQRNSRGEYKAYEISGIYTLVKEPASEKAKKDDF